MKETTFAQSNFRYKKGERTHERNKLFNKHRKLNECMEEEASKDEKKIENIQDIDYHTFYSQELKRAINFSLQGPIPEHLPDLDLLTISLYRRAGRPVYQTRRPGTKDLDPHMTYESLLILAFIMNEKDFVKFGSVVKQFQREFRAYLALGSAEISEMAVIAAGNHHILQQQDVVQVVTRFGDNALWVLINHVYEQRVNSRYLLPYFIAQNERVFQVFSEITTNLRDSSILVLTQSDLAIDTLIAALDAKGSIVLYSLRIISNILGQSDQDYSRLFQNTPLLQRAAELLMKGTAQIKETVTFMLVHYAFEPAAATTLLRKLTLCQLLVEQLRSSSSPQAKVNILDLFSYIAYKGERIQVFRVLANKQLLELCEELLDEAEEVVISSLQLVCGLVELGQEFPDEEGGNMVAAMLESNFSLLNKVRELSQCQDEKIYGLCFSIIDLLSSSRV